MINVFNNETVGNIDREFNKPVRYTTTEGDGDTYVIHNNNKFSLEL